MYLPLSSTSSNNPGVTLDQGLMHWDLRWARVRMEGDAMFIKHPDTSLCVQANPARPHHYNVHPRSVCLLDAPGTRRTPVEKTWFLPFRRSEGTEGKKKNAQKTGQHEKTPSNCPAESCVTTGERIRANFARSWWLDASEGLLGWEC